MWDCFETRQWVETGNILRSLLKNLDYKDTASVGSKGSEDTLLETRGRGPLLYNSRKLSNTVVCSYEESRTSTNKLSDLAKMMFKQSTKGIVWFLLAAYVKRGSN